MPPAADAPVGFATVDGPIDGGGMSAPKLITSFADLKAAVSGDAPATVWIKGSLTGDLTVGSNKSLVGVCGAELHGHIEISGVSNVIVRNLTIVGYGVGDCSKDPSFDASVGCSSGHDAMSIQRSAHNIWIDHCDISDGTDGNLDITNAANHVTVSWTKFHYTARADNSGDDSTGASGHRFSNLVGSSDTPKTDDAHALAITWHHDWWADNVVERQPRVRFGQNHLFNDLWSSAQASDCVAAGKQAQIWLEHSIFHGVKNPFELRSADKDAPTSAPTPTASTTPAAHATPAEAARRSPASRTRTRPTTPARSSKPSATAPARTDRRRQRRSSVRYHAPSPRRSSLTCQSLGSSSGKWLSPLTAASSTVR
jgi:pectate lyase